MKKIVRKRTEITYQCSICKTEYPSKRAAEKCEKRILEQKAFAKKDKVRNFERRTCSKDQKTYLFKGKVVKIIGPLASNHEYEVKWLGGKPERINGHVFLYQVRFKCPRCHQTQEEQYYAPELIKIK